MSSDIKNITLSEACVDVSYGYTESASNEVIGPKFLRITDIQNGIVDWNTVPYCKIEDTKIAKYLLEEGDIVIARTGNSTGENYAFRGKCMAVYASYLIRYRIDKQKFNPFFVWYNLRSHKWFDFVASVKGGSAQAGANAKVLGQFEIPLIDIDKQNNIVKILQDLDDKIANNNRINQTLEAIAQALFKSWFVDFESVKAKMQAKANGKDPQLAAMCAISGKTEDELQQLPQEKRSELAKTADLFPDNLVDSELGLIPEGWKINRLEDVTTLLSRGITPKYDDEGVVVINQRCIRDHSIDLEQARYHNETLREIKNKEVFIGDVLINSTGVGTLGRVATVKRLDARTTVDTHVTIVRANSDIIHPDYLGYFLLSNESRIEEMGEGSTGQTELKRTVLNEMKIVKPEVEVQNKFSEFIDTQKSIISNNELSNINLKAIRNSLLPKLLSGDIDLNN